MVLMKVSSINRRCTAAASAFAAVLWVLLLVCPGCASGGAGSSADVQAAQQWQEVILVWQAAQPEQYRVMATALEELPPTVVDEAQKAKVAALLQQAEADSRAALAPTRHSPAATASALAQVRALTEQIARRLHANLDASQYEVLSNRTRLVQLQLTAMTLPPEQLATILSNLPLSDDQRTRLEAIQSPVAIEHRQLLQSGSQAVPSVKASLQQRVAFVLDETQRLFESEVAARAEFRSALSPEALQRFDALFATQARGERMPATQPSQPSTPTSTKGPSTG